MDQIRLLVCVVVLAMLSGCSSQYFSYRESDVVESDGSVFRALASFYGPGFHGRKTANGEIFDQEALTAAHRSLPFGTILRVTRVDNGDSVTVRVNDRGPFIEGRSLDLSLGAARRLGFLQQGLVKVDAEVVHSPFRKHSRPNSLVLDRDNGKKKKLERMVTDLESPEVVYARRRYWSFTRASSRSVS